MGCFIGRLAMAIIKSVVKISWTILYKTGLYWLVLGFGCNEMYKQSKTANDRMSWMILAYICLAGTVIAIINRIMTKILKRKFNLVTEPFKALKEGIAGAGAGKEKGYYSKLKNKSMNVKGTILAKEKMQYVEIPNEEISHSSIIGGTGSGKTVNLLATILTNPCSMLILDGKDGGEIRQKSEKVRRDVLNQTIKFYDPDETNTFKFNPFEQFQYSEISDYTDVADKMATNMIEKSSQEKNSMWVDNARILLSGIILYNVLCGNDFRNTMEFVQLHSINEIIDIIKNAYENDNEKFKQAYKKIAFFNGMADETLTGINSNMMSKLSAFSSEKVLNSLSGFGNYISPADLEKNTTIYFNMELSKAQDQWKAVSKLFLNAFFDYFSKRGKEVAINNVKPKKILFVLDEFTNYGSINKIENQVSFVRSAGVSMIIAFQSLSQIDSVYGKDVRKILLDNMSYQVVLKIKDEETAKSYSNMTGTFDKKRISKSQNNNLNQFGMDNGFGNGINTGYEEKNLIKPEEFAYLPDKNECILFMPDGIAKCKKVLYYKDTKIQNLINTKKKGDI